MNVWSDTGWVVGSQVGSSSRRRASTRAASRLSSLSGAVAITRYVAPPTVIDTLFATGRAIYHVTPSGRTCRKFSDERAGW